VKQEMRENLLRRMREGATLFPGILGYDDTVLPQVENAILAGQDLVLLGERGQAKSRIARSLIRLLDDTLPAIAGCEIHDDPYAPVCRACRLRVAERGEATDVEWVPRDRRYGEKLATPDITIADLIGEVDPIKVAEGRYLADELTIHYGLIPRTHRGIFCINELPDLAERIQVGLLNLMEERDVQIRGYAVRLPLDLFVVASANPEDYTNRGRIITPLKDRFGSEVRTHYPRTLADEMAIMEMECARITADGIEVTCPRYMKEVVAEVTQQARRSPEISQRSGVSVRVSIANYENVVANAVRRAVRLGERLAVPRISDLPALVASTAGKIELDSTGEAREDRLVERLVRQAVAKVFREHFQVAELDAVVQAFDQGLTISASESLPAAQYAEQVARLGPLRAAIAKLIGAGSPAAVAAGMEFILEGLHLAKRLNKDEAPGQVRYRR
jgi:magnesium chelatase subunit I